MKKKVLSLIMSAILLCGFCLTAFADYNFSEDADVSEETLTAIIKEHLTEKYADATDDVGNYARQAIAEMLEDPEFVAAVIRIGVKAYIKAFLLVNGALNEELIMYAGDAVDEAIDKMVTGELIAELTAYPLVRDILATTAEYTVVELVRRSGLIDDRDALIASCADKAYNDMSGEILTDADGNYKTAEKLKLNKYWAVSGDSVVVKVKVWIFTTQYTVYKSYAITGWDNDDICSYCDTAFALKSIKNLAKYYRNVKNAVNDTDEFYAILFSSMTQAAKDEFASCIESFMDDPIAAFNYYLAGVLSEKIGYDVTIDPDSTAATTVMAIIEALKSVTKDGVPPEVPGTLAEPIAQLTSLALAFTKD